MHNEHYDSNTTYAAMHVYLFVCTQMSSFGYKHLYAHIILCVCVCANSVAMNGTAQK